jgi:hypothetical protein
LSRLAVGEATMASQQLKGERDHKLDDTRALNVFRHQITEHMQKLQNN